MVAVTYPRDPYSCCTARRLSSSATVFAGCPILACISGCKSSLEIFLLPDQFHPLNLYCTPGVTGMVISTSVTACLSLIGSTAIAPEGLSLAFTTLGCESMQEALR